MSELLKHVLMVQIIICIKHVNYQNAADWYIFCRRKIGSKNAPFDCLILFSIGISEEVTLTQHRAAVILIQRHVGAAKRRKVELPVLR